MESIHSNDVGSVHSYLRQALPAKKQLPYCKNYLPPCQILYIPQELTRGGPGTAYSEVKPTLSKTGLESFPLAYLLSSPWVFAKFGYCWSVVLPVRCGYPAW